MAAMPSGVRLQDRTKVFSVNMPARNRFRRVSFGYSSAETESSEEPGLLLDAFLDQFSAADTIAQGKGLLILGTKGSGKSAIGERLRLIAQQRHDLFVNVRHLSAFPYKRFGSIVPGKDEIEIRYPRAWDFLLLVTLCNSLARDEKAQASKGFDAIKTVLRANNLLEDDDLRQLAATCIKKSFQVKLPIPFVGGDVSLGGSVAEPQTPEQIVAVPIAVDLLERAFSQCRSESQHILVIDGLDDVLITNSNQSRVLSALIQSATQLNRMFHHSGVPASIVVLCRTDIFQSIPNPNKNKIRQDHGIHLDWYHDPQHPENSGLVALANLRCRESECDISDVFEECFPQDITGQNIRKWLLDHTRHTPRDFLQLLRYIQQFVKPSDRDERITRAEIVAGARKYSIDYFLPEIRDSLVGMLPDRTIAAGLKTLTSLRKREFTSDEFALHLRDLFGEASTSNVDVRVILEHLFNVGAIGNITRFPNHVIFTFKFRNSNSTVNYREGFAVHKGLWKALNLA